VIAARPLATKSLGLGAYYGILAIALIGALGPTLWVIASSFKTLPQVYSGSNLFYPHPATIQAYRDALQPPVQLHHYLFNTFIYAAGGTIGAVTTGLLAAYPTARLRFPFRNVFVVAFSLALAVPVIGLIVPEFFIMEKLHLFDQKIGLVLFYSAIFFPISFVIQRAFLVSLPYELDEAGIVDGAGYFTILTRIIAPLAVPGLATVAVVVFIWIWNEYFFANLLTISFHNWNIQLALAQFKQQFHYNVPGALAGATLSMLVPITAFLLLQRYVVAGLTAGSSR
jgi:raffinose/stachyose/melibiose transport system permease protein